MTINFLATMKTNNMLSFHRLGLLFKQNFIYQTRLLGMSILAVFGLISLTFTIIYVGNNFGNSDYDDFISVFLVMFFAIGVLYIGHSFPSFRTKEKKLAFLLQPSTIIEKYVFEYFSKVFLYILIMPLLFQAAHIFVGVVIQMLHSGFEFKYISYFEYIDTLPVDTGSTYPWFSIMLISCGMLLFNVAFVGASAIQKYPLLKTVFIVVAVFLFHLFIVYFFLEILDFSTYRNEWETVSISADYFMNRFMAIYTILINIGLMVAAYFILKEKEA